MRRLTAEDLRRSTLRRQFPTVDGSGAPAVVDLFDRVGPIQSQVPRAPFLAAAARLPGTTYQTLRELFDSSQLLKASSLRGTVHTSNRHDFAWLDAVATRSRATTMRTALRLQVVTPAEVDREVRRFCTDWTRREDIVSHIREWLARRESSASAAALHGTFSESIVWGNSGLIRGTRNGAWEKRSDTWHRTATALLPELGEVAPATALAELIRRHLVAYGPLTRNDLSFFFGVGLRQVDVAVTSLGDEVEHVAGPGLQDHLDLADPPRSGSEDPGCKLLGEFDGLLLGFSGPNRTRFVDEDGLTRIWAKTNGLFKPVVLHEGRLVATWRLQTRSTTSTLEVSMLHRGRPLAEDLFAGPSRDVATALGVPIGDVRVSAASD